MGNKLIRNNKDIPENIRDPEQLTGRLQHFWDAHDLGRQYVDPRGPFEAKYLALRREPSNKFSPFISANMPYEGSVSEKVMATARAGLTVNGTNRDRLRNSMVHITSPAIMLTGDRVARIDSPIDNGEDWDYQDINPTGSSEPIWKAHRNAVKGIQKGFEEPDKHDLLSYQDTVKGIHDAAASYTMTEKEQMFNKRLDPRYVTVSVLGQYGKYGPPSIDTLDLHTGNWARILQGNQFNLE